MFLGKIILLTGYEVALTNEISNILKIQAISK